MQNSVHASLRQPRPLGCCRQPIFPGHDNWITIYQDTDNNCDLYEPAEKLMDLEDSFQRWRIGHLIAVQRIIGPKRGTGGTSVVNYLAKALEYRILPKL